MINEEIIKKFGLPFSNFSQPIIWTDGSGFSITQSYGDGYSSIYKFGIYDIKKNDDLKNIFITVSYGKETEGGISLGIGKNGIWDPVDLNFNNEFFYSKTQGEFFYKTKTIEARELLIKLEETHKKPTLIVKGFYIRTKLWVWRKLIPNLIKFIDLFLIDILYLISGEKVKKDIFSRYFSEKYSEKSDRKIEEKIEFEKGKTMEFFGYQAKRWSVVFYCFMHLFIYYFYFYIQNNHYNLTSTLSKNNFLGLCYIVVSFTITESLVPEIIKTIISKTPKFFAEVGFKGIKI